MKKLELNQMENLQGGGVNRDCLVRGAGFALSVVGGFFFAPLWGAAMGIAATSAHCY